MWRAMTSLLVLRDQANLIAPNRSRASDGLVGDEAHQDTNSDHNPHYVPGVGSEIVTALDLTHDPAHGFDSYDFAEALRRNRDRRIKYVISNHRIFSSYASGSRPAWTWGTYNGIDPHTNHVHVSVLDAVISDTNTPWNLDGFEVDMTPTQQYIQHVMNYRIIGIIKMQDPVIVPAFTASDGSKFPNLADANLLAQAIRASSGELTPTELEALANAIANHVVEDLPPAITPPTAEEIADAVVAKSPTVKEIAAASAQATIDEIAS